MSTFSNAAVDSELDASVEWSIFRKQKATWSRNRLVGSAIGKQPRGWIAFRLGVEREKIYATMVPVFPHLEEKNVREGFPSDEEYTKLKDACPKEGIWLRTMLELAATFGWRKGSLLRMRVSNVDLLAGTVREEGRQATR
jgi:integrase